MVWARPGGLRLTRREIRRFQGIDVHRPGNILQALLPPVLERQDSLPSSSSNTLPEMQMPPGSAMPLEADGDVHAVPEDVAVLANDDVAQVDPHS